MSSLSAVAAPGATTCEGRSWSILDPTRGEVTDDVRRRWATMAEASDNPFALLQSPEWFDHLRATGPGALFLAEARDGRGDLAAVAPLEVGRRRLGLDVARRLRIPSPTMTVLRVLGGSPLTADGGGAAEGLLGAVLGAFPGLGAIDLFGVCTDSPFHDALRGSGLVGREFFLERRPGLAAIDTIPLPGSFAEFLSRYDAKKRYNLRRQLKLLQGYAGGSATFRRLESPDDAAELFDAVENLGRALDGSSVAAEPGRTCEVEKIRDVARRGLLRGYLLEIGGRPAACVMGKQFGRTYQVDWTDYDREFRALSPGTSLLCMAIEDLIEHRPATLVNLGYGHPTHDFRATNVRLACESLWLIRKTWSNRALWSSRALIRSSARACRALARRGGGGAGATGAA